MKKILLAALALPLLFTSCKDDDNSSPAPSDPDLVKVPAQTITRSGQNFQTAITTHWQYNGQKVVSASDSNGNYREYIYEGLRIKRILTYLSTGVLLRTEVFFYDGQGRLTTSQILGSSTGQRYEYTYTDQGTIQVANKIGNAATQTTLNSNSVITLVNGEIASIQTTYIQEPVTETLTFTYDDKLKPTKNVLGFDKIAYAITTDVQRMGVNHNVTSITQTTIGGLDNTDTRTFTYAGDNFPTMMLHTDSNPNDSYKIEYTYMDVEVPSN